MQPGRYPFVAASFLLTSLLLASPGPAAQRTQTITVPADTVVHVKLDKPLTSKTARIGQPVTATMAPTDLGGFPTGTRFEGIVTDVRPATSEGPGQVAVRWHAAVLPNPETVPANGRPWSLGPEATWRDDEGRLIGRDDTYRRFDDDDDDDDDGFDPKWIGYGAAGGAVLGGLFGGGILEGALLGGLGGAAYGAIEGGVFGSVPGETRPVRVASAKLVALQGNRHPDVMLDRGADFGIRFSQPVTFTAKDTLRYPSRAQALRDARVLGTRQELFRPPVVTYGGRGIEFDEARPVTLDGVPLVPLQPIAQAAGLRYTHGLGTPNFAFRSPLGDVTGAAGRSTVMMGDRQVGIYPSPVLLNGEVYVHPRFLNRVAGMNVTWNPIVGRLELMGAR